MKKKPLTEEEKDLCNGLIHWLEGVDKNEIDACLEWLGDEQFFNKKGKRFAWCFWDTYIHEKEVKI